MTPPGSSDLPDMVRLSGQLVEEAELIVTWHESVARDIAYAATIGLSYDEYDDRRDAGLAAAESEGETGCALPPPPLPEAQADVDQADRAHGWHELPPRPRVSRELPEQLSAAGAGQPTGPEAAPAEPAHRHQTATHAANDGPAAVRPERAEAQASIGTETALGGDHGVPVDRWQQYEVTAYLRPNVADHDPIEGTSDLQPLLSDADLLLAITAADPRAAAERAYAIAGRRGEHTDDHGRRWPSNARTMFAGDLLKVADGAAVTYYRVIDRTPDDLREVSAPENPVLPLHRVQNAILAYPPATSDQQSRTADAEERATGRAGDRVRSVPPGGPGRRHGWPDLAPQADPARRHLGRGPER